MLNILGMISQPFTEEMAQKAIVPVFQQRYRSN